MQLAADERNALVAWIGERPATLMSIHALVSGIGRVAVAGDVDAPTAVLVESAVNPGEPQGFGDVGALVHLLGGFGAWGCVELAPDAAADMRVEFDRRWGLTNEVVDVIHVLDEAGTRPEAVDYPAVRRLDPSDVARFALAPDLFPSDPRLLDAAVARGWVFGAVDGGVIVGQASALVAGDAHAELGIQVAPSHRRRGIAAAAAAFACRAVMDDGLMPVWGASTDNVGSRRVAEKLGFVEVERLIYLVRD